MNQNTKMLLHHSGLWLEIQIIIRNFLHGTFVIQNSKNVLDIFTDLNVWMGLRMVIERINVNVKVA